MSKRKVNVTSMVRYLRRHFSELDDHACIIRIVGGRVVMASCVYGDLALDILTIKQLRECYKDNGGGGL